MSDKIMTPEEFKEWYAKWREAKSWNDLYEREWSKSDGAVERLQHNLMQAYGEYYHKEMVKEIGDKNNIKSFINGGLYSTFFDRNGSLAYSESTVFRIIKDILTQTNKSNERR